MRLKGTLEKLDFTDLLQMLASSGKSGKLTLTQYAGHGLIVLRHGKIIYAASGSARETLGNMLLCKGLVTEDDLKSGLEHQNEAEEERRLGTILVENGALSQETLESVLAEQVERALSEFLGWNSGFFSFEEILLPDRGEVGIDAADLLLDEGLPADRVLLHLSRELDEKVKTSTSEDSGSEGAAALLPTVDRLPTEPAASRLISLKSIMAELHSPEFTSEVTLGILNYGQKIVHRGILFSVSRLGISGMGQFGVAVPDSASPDSVRKITVPLGQPSILTEAIARKAVYRGPLEENSANRLLLRRLGGGWPGEVVAAPLIVGGRALLIFYGDNLPENDPIGSVADFELVLVHAGLAMEKNVLAKRVEYLEGLRRHAKS